MEPKVITKINIFKVHLISYYLSTKYLQSQRVQTSEGIDLKDLVLIHHKTNQIGNLNINLQNLSRMSVLDRLEFSTFARSSLSFRLCRRFVRVRLGIGIALWVIRLQSRVLVKVFVLTQVLPEAAILENKIEYSKCLKSECSDFGAL